jgi:uncharacterized damage-inducible protein DinB
MNESPLRHYLNDAITVFRDYKRLAEKAFEQISDEELFLTLDEESNSIAVIIQHMSGNMLSRWRDFLTSDREKPDRNRDMEFVLTKGTSREQLLARWEKGWSCVFEAVEALQPEDLERRVLIRGEQYSVIEAINRQMTHYAYHTGQIVFLAKHIRSADWKYLSIPRDRSAEFNAHLIGINKEAAESTRQERFNLSLDHLRNAE